MKQGKLLIIDDHPDVLIAAKLLLKQHFEIVDTDKNPENLLSLMRRQSYDVFLLDMNFTKDVSSGVEGFYWLDKILDHDAQAVVILITAFGDVEMAVRAIKAGAMDFVLKPWSNDKLVETLLKGYTIRQSRREVEKLQNSVKVSKQVQGQFGEMLGVSPAMQAVFETLRKVAYTDANVLILGENGTGKQLVAQAIHQYSQRAGEAFVGVDLGAVSQTLFESELFGHVKGSFTDAKEDRTGKFESADGGTLFLDEIGNIPMAMQSKLLTVLQGRTVTRVGASRSRAIDIRLVCATNMPLYDMIGKGEFRQDLLYRVNTIEVRIPALRERTEDIELLANHYLKIYCHRYRRNIKGLSPQALLKLQKYDFPGNVRELQHAIERAVILSDSDSILEPQSLVLTGNQNHQADEKNTELMSVDSFNLEELEKAMIRKILKKHDGNISKAADELGLTRASLYRRLEKYGL
jgi:DNA-binding NtrC family response regulator